MTKNERRKTVKKAALRRPSQARKKSRNFLEEIFAFRWLKKSIAKKSREESVDLLDQWILKKRALSLFL
jgi:hypothetical protein